MAAPPDGPVLPHVSAIRYVTPLREGGSLPGLMEADDLGTYVVKFSGAGQGPAALVAEVISGGLARALDLPVPALAGVEVDPALAASEPDEEVQDLLRASPGLNLAMDFLPGALDFDPAVFAIDAALAARILWFDALVNNVDRSWKNPNMLWWHRAPYLIDHGATLSFHHNWPRAESAVRRPYDPTGHVLVAFADGVPDVDAPLRRAVTPALLEQVVATVPDAWITDVAGFPSPDRVRTAYVEWLAARVAAADEWLVGFGSAA